MPWRRKKRGRAQSPPVDEVGSFVYQVSVETPLIYRPCLSPFASRRGTTRSPFRSGTNMDAVHLKENTSCGVFNLQSK